MKILKKNSNIINPQTWLKKLIIKWVYYVLIALPFGIISAALFLFFKNFVIRFSAIFIGSFGTLFLFFLFFDYIQNKTS